MRLSVQEEIKNEQLALSMADRYAHKAWIAGNAQEVDKWMRWALRLEERIERLRLIANKGV